MMKYWLLLFIAFYFLSCGSKKTDTKVDSTTEVDTVYGNSFRNDPTYKKFLIRTSYLTEMREFDFKVGKKDTLKISIPGFEEYPIDIVEPENVRINEKDSVKGIFILTPLDTTFQFRLLVNYGVGNVVFKTNKKDSGYIVKPFDGNRNLGIQKFKASK